jgi:hypothetical protein
MKSEEEWAIEDAASAGNIELLNKLLSTFDRSAPGAQQELSGALFMIESPECALALLKMGGATGMFLDYGRWALLGIPGWEHEHVKITQEEFVKGRKIVFGSTNPEEVMTPYLRFAIRSRYQGYSLCSHCGSDEWGYLAPIWSAYRFGQSLTQLPDGRWVEIGGLHNDSQDTAIFNDVIVTMEGEPRLFRYPAADFRPVYRHAAVLVENSIFIIGGKPWVPPPFDHETEVYKLDLRSMSIDKVDVVGPSPGYIFDHSAWLVEGNKIQIFGGERRFISSEEKEPPEGRSNFEWQIDLERMAWDQNAARQSS